MASIEIVGSYGSFLPSFLGISILSSIVAVLIYVPTNMQEGSLFCTASPALLFEDFFDDNHFDQYEVISRSFLFFFFKFFS